MPDFIDSRLTERRNQRTAMVDVASSLEIVDMMNREDAVVPGAVHTVRERIAAVVDRVVESFQRGGRLIYVGAGTSGRLGVLDAAECPPTFGTPPEWVVGIIAGGPDALARTREGAEDNENAGRESIVDTRVGAGDVVIGIAASGSTPFVRAALEESKRRGAYTAFLTCSDPSGNVEKLCDELLFVPVGPEALTGSTRLKAGTATKLVLNTITTAAMIRSGRAYGNLMVDLRASSAKLEDRGERILMEVCGVDRPTAGAAIEQAGGSVKAAIVMLKLNVGLREADHLLIEHAGLVRNVVGDPPPVRE